MFNFQRKNRKFHVFNIDPDVKFSYKTENTNQLTLKKRFDSAWKKDWERMK